MGIRLSYTADFVMEDVFVPADRLIGTEGNGFAQTTKFLAGKRPVSVAGRSRRGAARAGSGRGLRQGAQLQARADLQNSRAFSS
jgi:Acyl-CoA dehydrogenases